MLLVPLTLIIAAVGVLYIWLKKRYSYWLERGIPHEKPVLFLGNMRGIGRELHWKDINQRIYDRFKGTAPFVGFYSFLTPMAFILDLDLIKRIMVKDFNCFANRGMFNNVHDDPLTENLLFLDGKQWSSLRHELSPVFTTGKMRFMFPTMLAASERLVDTCMGFITKTDGQMEAKDLCARYTTDVIGTCAFGIECNSLADPNAEFRRMGRSVMEEPRHTPIIQAFMFSKPALAKKLRMKNFKDDVSEFFINAVRETVDYRQRNNVKRNDFMDMLIEMKEKRDKFIESGMQQDVADDFSHGLTLEQVAAQAMVFFLAGFDTSSTTMSFCIYELAQNPNIQETLRAEIFDVLEKYDGQVTYENIREMSYLEKVISETLRKYSVLPHVARETTRAFQVPDSDIVFEPGLRIVIPIDCLHKDPELYPNPEEFNPERFRPTAIAARHPFAYLPFGDGPRNCIGMRFGKMQAVVGIITLLRNFRFSITEHTQIPIRYSLKSFLVAPQSGIHLKVEKLKRE